MPGQFPRNFEEYLRKLEREIGFARRAPISIVNGAIEVLRVEREARDTRKPAAPIELTYQTAIYMSRVTYESGPRARFIMDFPDVTKATDGTDIVIDHYELWGRDVSPTVLDITTSAAPGVAAPGLTAPGLAATTTDMAATAAELASRKLTLLSTSPTSGFRADGFQVGTKWEFIARAIGVNNIVPGQNSATVTVQMLDDSTAPPQPVAPTVTSSRGQLIVTVSGLSVSGAMPADMSYLSLAHGGDAQPTEEVARFGREGGIHVQTGIDYYDIRFFRVRAIDERGNAGPWSAVATGFTTPLVDEDIILSELDAATTHLKNVDAGISILPNTVIAEHLVATESMASKIGQFLHLKAGQIDVNSLWTDNAFIGYAEANLIRSDIFVGRTFEGGVFTTTLGGKFQTNPEDLKGVKLQSDGIKAWNPTTGELTYHLDATTGNMLALGTFRTDLTGSRIEIADYLNTSMVNMWSDDTANHSTIYGFHDTAFTGDDGYGTQMTHFSSTGAQESYMLLGKARYSMRLGDTNSTEYYMIMEEAANLWRVNIPSGRIEIEPGELYIEHAGTDQSAANPYMQLYETDRRVKLGTGAAASAPNDYAMFQMIPNAIFMRQNDGNYSDLTDTGYTVAIFGATAYLTVQESTFEMKMAKGSHMFMGTNGNWTIGSTINIDTFGRGRIDAGQDSLSFYPTGSGGGGTGYSWCLMRFDQPTQFVGGMNVFGNFSVFNGTKNFVMPHPTKIGKELVHAATESPWSGIQYWGTGTTNKQGFWIVQLPEYFEHIAAKDQRLVTVTSPTGKKLVWDHEIVNGEFMVEGEPDTPFGWEVLARREGYDVEVEPWVSGRRSASMPFPPLPNVEPDAPGPPKFRPGRNITDDGRKNKYTVKATERGTLYAS